MSIFGNRLSQKANSLKHVPLFSDLEPTQLELLAQTADEIPVTAGAVLASQGSFGEEFIFILEGTAKVEKDGKEISKLAAGEYFGEIALLDKGPRTATVTASSDMNLLVVHARAFNHLLETIPKLSQNMLTALCTYIRRLEAERSD